MLWLCFFLFREKSDHGIYLFNHIIRVSVGYEPIGDIVQGARDLTSLFVDAHDRSTENIRPTKLYPLAGRGHGDFREHEVAAFDEILGDFLVPFLLGETERVLLIKVRASQRKIELTLEVEIT